MAFAAMSRDGSTVSGGVWSNRGHGLTVFFPGPLARLLLELFVFIYLYFRSVCISLSRLLEGLNLIEGFSHSMWWGEYME